MAIALAECGADVAVVARDQDGTEILHSLSFFPGKHCYIAADLSKPLERSGIITKSEEMFGGGVDILINNAGTVVNGTAANIKEEDWIFARELLLDSVVDLTRQALEGMINRKYGKIVNIASVCAYRNASGAFSYSVLKRAITGVTECAAKHAAKYNVNINCIAPGTIKTDLTKSRGDFDPQNFQRMLSNYPAGRLGEPEDIANAMLYLVSDMSSFVNGHTLVVDGGYLT